MNTAPHGIQAGTAPAHDDSRALTSLREQCIELVGQGLYTEALNCFQRGCDAAASARNAGFQTRFLINLANVRLIVHEYRAAMDAYLEAERLAGSAGDQELVAVLSSNMAWLYGVMGAYEDAASLLARAMDTLPPEGRDRHLPRILAQRAVLLWSAGRYREARRDFLRSLEEADRRGDLEARLSALEGFGYRLLRHGESATAEAMLTEAVRLRRTNHKRIPADIYRNFSLLRLRQGDIERAEKFADLSFEAARSKKDTAPVWSIYYARAEVQIAAGKWREAFADLELALRYVRDLRLSVLPSRSVYLGAGQLVNKVFDSYIEVANQIGLSTGDPKYTELAFLAAEEHRAATLRRSPAEFEQIRYRLSHEYWSVLERLKRVEQSEFRTGNRADSRRLQDLRHRLTELEIETGLPLVTRSAIPEHAHLESLREALGPDEALLSFHLSGHGSFLWSLTQTGLELYPLAEKTRLNGLARAYRNQIETPVHGAAAEGRELYREIFGALGAQVRSKTDWILCLDGDLFGTPLAALPTDNGTFLIQEHSLRVIPGAFWLLERGRNGWTGPMVTVSDPVYNRADPRWRSADGPAGVSWWRQLTSFGMSDALESQEETGPEMARLAGGRREIEACRRAAPVSGVIELSGLEANRAHLLKAIEKEPGIVHFATHVIPSKGSADGGYIALSLLADGKLDLLGTTEIGTLQARPALVVLSGCHSGAGKILPGEGLFGLTRAWLRAGSGSVAATLWPTRDDSGELLSTFYRNLGTLDEHGFALAPQQALRRAQLQMVRAGGWKASPDYWASYYLMTRN